MSKELEALKKLKDRADHDEYLFRQDTNKEKGVKFLEENNSYVSSIEQALKEHEQYKAIEDELGISLVTFLKGVNPNTCFMEITKDKKLDFCGDAYHGTYTKEKLLKLIQQLLFMYWALTREELEK